MVLGRQRGEVPQICALPCGFRQTYLDYPLDSCVQASWQKHAIRMFAVAVPVP